jgi:hypothetical protein
LNFLQDGIHHNTAALDDAGSSALSNLTPVNVDFDGEPRHPSHPDIGADEFAHYDMKINKIIIDTSLCTYQSSPIRVLLKNTGPGPFNDSLWLQLSIDSALYPIWLPILTQAINGSDTISVLADSLLHFSTASKHQVSCVGYFYGNPYSNGFDTLHSDSVTVREPLTGFLGNDTIICVNHSFSLNPTQSFLSYLWYDGSTQSTLFLPPNTQTPGILPISLAATDEYCINHDTLYLEISDCQGIDESEAQDFMVFPNPCENQLNIEVPADFINSRILIINAQGEIVDNFLLDEPQILLDIGRLSAGYHQIVVINSCKHMHCSFIKL